MAKKRKNHPFRERDTEVERDNTDVESEGEAGSSVEATGNGANDSAPAEPSATANEPEPKVEPQINVGRISSIGPSELLDRLEAAKTGKAKIAAGRAFIEANPDEVSERMVEVLGSNPRDRTGGGKDRAVGYWPGGTVRKANAILQASPRGGA